MDTPVFQPSDMQNYAMQGAGELDGSSMQPTTKRKIFYTLISFLLLTLTGALGYFVDRSPIYFYWGFCLSFLGLGVLHLYLMQWLEIFGEDHTFASRMLFSVVIVLLALLGFFFTFYFLSHKSGYSLYFALTVWYLLVPMAIVRCFDLALAVPARDYKQWHYPAKPIVLDMDSMDLSNFAIITYVFSKRHGDSEKSNLQSKAPYECKLGDLFYGFINEWNRRYPQANIEYLDEQKQTFGWLFYVQDKWYQKKRFLDPDRTVRDNNILVNQIIQTLRVPQYNIEKIA